MDYCFICKSLRMKIIRITLQINFILAGCLACAPRPTEVLPQVVIPTENQVMYQQMETIGFIHFGINTFTGKEWGFGDEIPSLFNPTRLDVEQWVTTARAGGLKELILTAKHHDGFCLWPSEYTEHSIKNSPYKNRKGDIVREFVDACRKGGIKVGLYLSPWDWNHKDYGRPEYITYYYNQLRELLTNYGEINEIWFDGANGGDGFYGGVSEMRRIDRKSYYPWDEIWSLAKSMQPDIMIWSPAGPDVRWVGNEKGHAGETFWSTISNKDLVIGGADKSYLNTGEPRGNKWMIGQCDVSIRPGWFYHEKEDSLVKSPGELMDIYFKSVGRNGLLLLNLPPDQRGLIHENDAASLAAFKRIIDETFSNNLARNKTVTASNVRLKNKYFSAGNVVDGDPDTYWATDDRIREAELVVDLGETVTFDVILIQEPIVFGQRISEFEVFAEINGTWMLLSKKQPIGYKRLLKINPTAASKIKLNIKEANGPPALSNFELFLSSN